MKYLICKSYWDILVDLKLYRTDPRESPTNIKSVCLSIICAIFFEYAVRQTILDLFFFNLNAFIFDNIN